MRIHALVALVSGALVAGCGGGGDDHATVSAAAFGAVGDGTTDNTRAIQAALDAAGQRPGSTVSFAPGTYMTGALFIRSNTTLQVDAGVTLKAIQAPTWWNLGTTIASGAKDGLDPAAVALYPQVQDRVQGIDMTFVAAIINMHGVQNVAIRGAGTIDGNGQAWWTHYYGEGTRSHAALGVTWALNWDEERPRGIESFDSKNVTIQGVTVRDSPFWTVHVAYSDQVHIDGVSIYNMPTPATGVMPSTDGIDLDSSSNVLVENCDIVANDDGFVIKSGRDGEGLKVNRPTENVVIRNSVVRAGATAFTIGSETSGGANDIEVYGIRVEPLTGLINSNVGYKVGGPAVNTVFSFKSAPTRGGTMQNVYVHDVAVDDAYYFMTTSGSWPTPGTVPGAFGTAAPATYLQPPFWAPTLELPATPEAGYFRFKNFRFRNITMAKVETSVFAVAGVTIADEAEAGRFTNFSFDDIHIHAVKASGASASAGSITNAGHWTFTNSTVVNAAGANIVPTLNPTTTDTMTGLAGW